MTRLIEIGHSRGIRIPKSVIQQAQLENCELTFHVSPKGLLIKPRPFQKRQTWIDAFQKALPLASDEIDNISNQFDDEDWVWEEIHHE